MNKQSKQFKKILLVALLLISPALWISLGDIPTSFSDSRAWVNIMTIAVLAFAVYVAFDSNKK